MTICGIKHTTCMRTSTEGHLYFLLLCSCHTTLCNSCLCVVSHQAAKSFFLGGVNRPELSDVVSADLVMCFLLLISTPLFISSNCCWRRRESTKPVYSQLAFSEFAITVKRFNFTYRRSWTNTIKVDVLRLL